MNYLNLTAPEFCAVVNLHPDRLGDWRACPDPMTGCVYFVRHDSGVEVYATPDWDGADGVISWDAHTSDGRTIATGEIAWPDDGERTIASYLDAVTPVLASADLRRVLAAPLTEGDRAFVKQIREACSRALGRGVPPSYPFFREEYDRDESDDAAILRIYRQCLDDERAIRGERATFQHVIDVLCHG